MCRLIYLSFYISYLRAQQCSKVEINSFGPPPWMVKIQSPDFNDCSGVVLGDLANRVLTDADCCPDDATLLVSRGVVGSFVLRIIRRFYKGSISTCLLHLEDYVMFTQPACLPTVEEIESSALPNGSKVTVLSHASVQNGIWTNDCKIDENGSSPCVLMNNVKCESYQGAAVYGEFNSKNETEESSSKKRFKGIVTAYDTHSGSGNDDCSLILTVEEADDSLLDWIQFTKAPVTTQRPKKRKRKPKATPTPHWAKTTTTSTTTSTTSTSSTTRSTTLTTITTSTKHLTTSTAAQSTTKPNEATTVSNPTSVGKSHSETTTYMETTASLKSEMEWLETSTQQSNLFINNPSTKQNQVYELGECADVSQQVEIDDLVSVDCRAAECFFSCPMNRSPNIPYLIRNNETNEWIIPEFAEKVFCRMLDPEISLIDFLVKERPVFCKETPKALTPNEVQEFCNPYFCIISCADEERTIFCNDGLWPENEFNC